MGKGREAGWLRLKMTKLFFNIFPITNQKQKIIKKNFKLKNECKRQEQKQLRRSLKAKLTA